MASKNENYPLVTKKMTLNKSLKIQTTKTRHTPQNTYYQHKNNQASQVQINYFNFFRNKSNRMLQKINIKQNQIKVDNNLEVKQNSQVKEKKDNIKKDSKNILSKEQKRSRQEKRSNKNQQQILIQQQDMVEVGSQYGDHNYDQDLKKVIHYSKKHNTKNGFQQYEQIPSSTKNNQQNIFQIFQNKDFHRDDKVKSMNFKNSNQIKKYSLSKPSLNSMKQIKQTFGQSPRRLDAHKKNKTQIKFYLNLYKQEEDNKTNFLKYKNHQSNSFHSNQIKNIFQQKQNKIQSPSNNYIHALGHHRSKTQEQIVSHDRKHDHQIFQKYENLKNQRSKDSFIKASFTNRTMMKKNFKDNNSPNKDSKIKVIDQNSNNEKATIKGDNNKRNSRVKVFQDPEFQREKNYKKAPKSQKKYQFVPIFQNIYKMGDSKSGICFSPKNTINDNVHQKNLRKLIKSRQKQFFQRVKTYGVQSTNFTIQQIKSRLQKIQKSQSIKNNKSVQVINNYKGNKQNHQFLINYKNNRMAQCKQLLLEESKNEDQQIIKFNGIKFKAKLMKKNQNIYNKNMRKPSMKAYLRQESTPKHQFSEF